MAGCGAGPTDAGDSAGNEQMVSVFALLICQGTESGAVLGTTF